MTPGEKINAPQVPTPRTDGTATYCGQTCDEHGIIHSYEHVPKVFARQLERELAEALNRLQVANDLQSKFARELAESRAEARKVSEHYKDALTMISGYTSEDHQCRTRATQEAVVASEALNEAQFLSGSPTKETSRCG